MKALFLPFALLALTLFGCQGEADFSHVMPEPVILPAESFRSEISTIDRLVFGESASEQGRRDALAKELDSLASRVKEASPSKFVAIESLELRALAAHVRRPVNQPLPHLPKEWMRIRSNLFDDQSWFARSAADLD